MPTDIHLVSRLDSAAIEELADRLELRQWETAAPLGRVLVPEFDPRRLAEPLFERLERVRTNDGQHLELDVRVIRPGDVVQAGPDARLSIVDVFPSAHRQPLARVVSLFAMGPRRALFTGGIDAAQQRALVARHCAESTPCDALHAELLALTTNCHTMPDESFVRAVAPDFVVLIELPPHPTREEECASRAPITRMLRALGSRVFVPAGFLCPVYAHLRSARAWQLEYDHDGCAPEP